MKNLSKAIYSKISGSALETAVNGRFYKGRAPEGIEYPYVVYMLISDIPDRTMSSRYNHATIQFSLFSLDSGSTEVEDMYTNLKALFDECDLTITAQTHIWMRRTMANLMIEDHTTQSGTRQAWHYAVEYGIIAKV